MVRTDHIDSVKDFFVMSWNGAWPWLSEGVALIILDIATLESHADFWIKVIVMLLGAVFGWLYLMAKTRKENKEADRIELENESKKRQYEIETENLELAIRKMTTEELIHKLAQQIDYVEGDSDIEDQLQKFGFHIDKELLKRELNKQKGTKK